MCNLRRKLCKPHLSGWLAGAACYTFGRGCRCAGKCRQDAGWSNGGRQGSSQAQTLHQMIWEISWMTSAIMSSSPTCVRHAMMLQMLHAGGGTARRKWRIED